MPTRRAVLRGLGGAGLAAAVSGVPASSVVALGGGSKDPVFTFASLPDFFNGDVADLRVLPTWDGGANSVNPYWLDAIDHCLGAVAAHRPDAVFVAGDAVEAHWNIDSEGRELFGPVSPGHRLGEPGDVPLGGHVRGRTSTTTSMPTCSRRAG